MIEAPAQSLPVDHVHRGANAAGMVRYPSAIAVVVGVALGVALSQAGPAEATRNSAGTYSLPGGNPVVSGTTISSAWANNTLADVATELTNSLDRQGRGGMLAPLKLANGSSTQPALSWTSDPDTGIYRAGAGDVRLVVDGNTATMQQWTPTGTSLYGLVDVEGKASFQDTATFIADSQFTGPATYTGGLVSTGTTSSGYGLRGTGGTPNGAGVFGLGVGNGPGGTFGGGPTGDGLTAFGGGSGTAGVTATGGPGGGGGYFIAGTAGTATVPQPAVTLVNGGLVWSSSTVDPNANVGFTDTLTPKNIIKAWGHIIPAGSGSTSVSVVDGFNVTSTVASGAQMTVTLAAPMANTNYGIFITVTNSTLVCSGIFLTTATFLITCRDISGAALPFPFYNFQTTATPGQARMYFAVVGSQ